MPSEQYLHDHSEFPDLIRIVADKLKIDPYLAEKDYWIMHCLYGLQQAGYDFQLKGGTSLSKGYGLIHRFSEDIDIHITPPESLGVKISTKYSFSSRTWDGAVIHNPPALILITRAEIFTRSPTLSRTSPVAGTRICNLWYCMG